MGRAGLTPKQRLFVDEYLVDLNATQAATRAGYSKRTAYAQGCRLLKDAEVGAAIKAAMDARAKRTHMTADDVLRELARVAGSDVLDYVTFNSGGVTLRESSTLTEDQARAISEVSETVNAAGQRSVKFKTHDKLRALDLLAKHFGLVVDRHKLDIGDGVEGINVTFLKAKKKAGKAEE